MRPAGNSASGRRWVHSLRFRLLAATLVALLVALLLAGVLLAGLFRDHVLRQFQASLASQLDQVTARLAFDAAGRPQLDAGTLSDPRWSRPYSGLYWQVDAAAGAPASRCTVRSSSSRCAPSGPATSCTCVAPSPSASASTRSVASHSERERSTPRCAGPPAAASTCQYSPE